VVLAYNPASGRFRGALLRRLEAALRKAGHRVTCRNSRDAPLTESGETPDLVCAFGGDGTARTLVERAPPLCVYPAGTINLLAREAAIRPTPMPLPQGWAPGRQNARCISGGLARNRSCAAPRWGRMPRRWRACRRR
jgi:diacylglycerol kinase family enzyme